MKEYDHEQKSYKRASVELDLKQCFWDLLEQWKLVLIVSVIVAIVISLLLGYRARINADRKAIKAANTDEIIASLSDSDKQEVYYTIGLQKMYYRTNDYYSNSPLMNLDSNNVKVLTCEWHITAEPSFVDLVVDQYKNELLNENSLREIVDTIGTDMDLSCFKELFDFSMTDNNTFIAETNYKVMRCQIYVPDDISESDLEEAVTMVVNGAYEHVKKQVADHTCKLVVHNTERGVSKELFNRQVNCLGSLISLRNNYYNNIQQLSTAQKNAFNQLLGINDNTAEKSTKRIPLFNLKYLIVGLVCGVLLYACLFLCLRSLQQRIVSADMLRTSYGFKKLGEIYTQNVEGKSTDLLHDRHIYRLQHRYKTSPEVQIANTEQAIRLQLHSRSLNRVVLYLLQKPDKTEAKVLERLHDCLLENGVSLKTVNVQETDSNQIKNLGEQGDGIIIVASSDSSAKELDSCLDMIELFDLSVYGYVYLG